MKPKILIIGAGFAGVFAAKKLDQLCGSEAEITLVSNTPHFELHANFYKVVSDCSPEQACIPLVKIFNNTSVRLVTDTIVQFSTKHKIATGIQGDRYNFDYALLTLGSQNAYFGIQGVSNFSQSLRTIQEAVRLSRHIHDTLTEKKENGDQGITEIAIVGGGPSGVEIAGELSFRLNELAEQNGLDRSRIKIELIEAMDHILPMLNANESAQVAKRLQKLGVNVKTNAKVEKEIETGLIINGDELKTKTVIWTAGAKAHQLYQDWGFQTGKCGRVIVNDYLQTIDNPEVYISGDGALAPGAGMAWPAIDMGETAAANIYNNINKKLQQKYEAKKHATFIPVGRAWGIAKYPNITLTGSLGFFARELHILRLLLKILPLPQVLSIIQSENEICSACDTHFTPENYIKFV